MRFTCILFWRFSHIKASGKIETLHFSIQRENSYNQFCENITHIFRFYCTSSSNMENEHISRTLNNDPTSLTSLSVDQSGISLNLRTGPTGHATLFNQWECALVFINKQIKTSPQWSKIFKTTDGGRQNQSSFRGSQGYFKHFSWGIHNFFKWTAYRKPYWKFINIQHILWLISSFIL